MRPTWTLTRPPVLVATFAAVLLVLSASGAASDHLPDEPQLQVSLHEGDTEISAFEPFFVQHGFALAGECADGEPPDDAQALIDADFPRFDLYLDGELVDSELVAGCFADLGEQDGPQIVVKAFRSVFEDGLAPGSYEFTGHWLWPEEEADSQISMVLHVTDEDLPFSDIAGTTHEQAIVAVVEADIASGFPDGTFRPGDGVTRGQMAAFLDRALDLPVWEPTEPLPFPDVAGTTHEASIFAVAQAGIASGFPDGTFRPGATVTRGQMATFIRNAFDLPPGEAPFDDVAGTAHEAAIGAVAEAGIAGGFPDGSYRPGDDVTRGQMATFMARALGLI